MWQLIPGADDAVGSETTFTIDRMKAAWRPTPAHLRTRSFPTPFAQAEMMAHVLGMLELIPGAPRAQPEAENFTLQQSYERWRLLVLGIVLGHLEIETVDLRSAAARRFGATLARLRPEAPFLGVLRAPDRAGIEGRKLVVGGTDPRAMVWCAPRVGSSAQHNSGYWSDLKGLVDTSAQRQDAMALLADWREVLRNNGSWSPAGEKSPPWMRAMEVLLAGTAHTERRLLSESARFVGPVQLAMPPRGASEPEDLVLYLPVLAPGYSTRFAELLFYQPTQPEREGRAVALVDPVGREVAEVPIAARDAGVGMELLAGVGQIRERPGVARVHGAAYWLEDQAGAPGYRKLVFEPLLAAAARSHRRVRFEEVDVAAYPILFPDAVRLLVSQPGADQPDGARIQLSRAVTARLRPGLRAPQSGLRVAQWDLRAPLPRIVAVPAGASGLSAGLVESFGPPDGAIDVGEVRALGFGLWLYYLGEAELRGDGVKVVWAASEEQDLFGRSVKHQAECPLEVSREALECVHDEPERVRARDLFATLQRFRRTWCAVGDGDGERPEVQGARLGRLAAESFLEWVLAGRDRLGEFGARATAPQDHYAIAERVRLPLYVDPYARWG